MKNKFLLPLIDNKKRGSNLFRRTPTNNIRHIILGNIYQRSKDEINQNESDSTMIINSQCFSQRYQTEASRDLLNSKPKKIIVKKQNHIYKKAFLDTIEEKLKTLDLRYKSCEKRSKLLIRIGDSNVKETQRFKKFNNQFIVNQQGTKYTKKITNLYRRINIYNTTPPINKKNNI